MKKILLGTCLFFLLLILMPISARAQSVTITADPTTASVGDKITFTIDVADTPAGSSKVKLYIADTVIMGPEGAYLKDSWDAPDAGASASHRYVWDTKAAGSNPGEHYVNVFVLDADGFIKLNQTTTYTLAAASSSPTPKPSGSHAGSPTPTPSGTRTSTSSSAIGDFGTIIFPSTKISSIRDLIVAIIDWLLILAGSLAVIAIIYSGIIYITAGADTTKAETAKKNLIWAIIGVVVISLALVIINTVVSVLQGNTGASSSTPTPSISSSVSPVPSPSYSMGPPLPPSPSPVYSMGPPLP